MTANNLSLSAPPMAQAEEADAQSPRFHPADVSLLWSLRNQLDATQLQSKRQGSPVSDFNKGNIKARSRMIAQYALWWVPILSAVQTMLRAISQAEAAHENETKTLLA